MKKVFQKRGTHRLPNAAKGSRGAMLFDNMESVVTSTRASFTGVTGRDTTSPSVNSSEKWKQTVDNIKHFYRKGKQRTNNGWGYTCFEDGKYSGVRRVK